MPARSPHDAQLDLPLFDNEECVEKKTTQTTLATTHSVPEPKPMPKSKRLWLALKAVHGDHSKLVLTDNRNVLLSSSRKKGILNLRVHQMFLDANDEVMEAIARFLKSGKAQDNALIDGFIKAQKHLLSMHAPELKENATIGKFHDLEPLFDDVNRRYFAGLMNPELTWGTAGAFKGRRRRSITLGSYDSQSHRVTIHPALDHKKVPSVVIERILHHELLHIKHPVKETPSGRRVIHGRAFRAEEALFVKAAEADRWMKEHLDLILKYRPTPAPKGVKSSPSKPSSGHARR
ncbi:MAG: hypothetical protein GY822_31270 [Deltaproteobacteria bacterium]|nr:hypothetical protein [Deltaproteobacteria bacterium]